MAKVLLPHFIVKHLTYIFSLVGVEYTISVFKRHLQQLVLKLYSVMLKRIYDPLDQILHDAILNKETTINNSLWQSADTKPEYVYTCCVVLR